MYVTFYYVGTQKHSRRSETSNLWAPKYDFASVLMAPNSGLYRKSLLIT